MTVIARDLPCEVHDPAMENGYHYCARCGHSLTPDGRDAVAVADEQLRGAVDDLREVARLLDRSTQTGKAPTRDEWAALENDGMELAARLGEAEEQIARLTTAGGQ